jgi:hypothetical protein
MASVTVFDHPHPLVTLEEAKIGLGEDGDHRNTLIAGMILAAQGEMDGPTGWLGMSVAVQGLEYATDDFSELICLPFGPPIEPIEICYLDEDGIEEVLDASVYRVLPSGSVVLNAGATWPAVYDQEGAVRINYFAGIENPLDPRVAIMKTAIIMHARMTLDGVEPEVCRRAIRSIVAPLWVARC